MKESNERMKPRAMWWTAVVFSLIGLLDSLYLAWIKLTDRLAVCGGIGDCQSVNSSRFAEIGGVPIAVIGALGYFGILIALLLDLKKPDLRNGLRLAFFGFTLTGTLYSLYLTYLELFVLHAICPYCVVSAIAMFVLFGLSIVMLRQTFQDQV